MTEMEADAKGIRIHDADDDRVPCVSDVEVSDSHDALDRWRGTDQSVLTFKDLSDPDSLVCLFEKRIADAIAAIPDGLAVLSESQLRKRYRLKLQPMDWMLRERLWDLVSRCRDARKQNSRWSDLVIIGKDIWHDICPQAHFYAEILPDKCRMAWLIQPYWGYEQQVKAQLQVVAAKNWDMLKRIKVFDADGNFDAEAAKLLVRITKELSERIYGTAVQRVNTKAVNMNVTGRASEIKDLFPGVEGESVDEKIARLTAAVNNALGSRATETIAIEGEVSDDGKQG